MTPDQCAGLLRDADPDRFAAVLAAQPGDRARLATLYAANLDIARAAVASKEPLIAEMRLQFWADQIAAMAAGRAPVRHDIATPLHDAWGAEIAQLSQLSQLVEARRHDTARQPFTDDAALLDYVETCTGSVMALACTACGWQAPAPLIRDQARGAGLAAWLGAYPALRALNLGLMPESDARLAELAAVGLAALDSARDAGRTVPRRAAPALYPGAGARRRLRAVQRGDLAEIPAFQQRLSRARLSLLGRWQG